MMVASRRQRNFPMSSAPRICFFSKKLFPVELDKKMSADTRMRSVNMSLFSCYLYRALASTFQYLSIHKLEVLNTRKVYVRPTTEKRMIGNKTWVWFTRHDSPLRIPDHTNHAILSKMKRWQLHRSSAFASWRIAVFCMLFVGNPMVLVSSWLLIKYLKKTLSKEV